MEGAAELEGLEARVREAVAQAVGDARAQQRAGAAAAEVDREQLVDQRVRRWQAIVAVTVAVGTLAVGGVTWVYQRGGAAQAQALHETAQDTQISELAAALERHLAEANATAESQRRALRDLGALQIEQGHDQRKILLRSAPPRVREELEERPAKLVEAERRVMRY